MHLEIVIKDLRKVFAVRSTTCLVKPRGGEQQGWDSSRVEITPFSRRRHGRKRKMDFTTRLDQIYIFRRATLHFHEKRIKGNFPVSLTQGQLEQIIINDTYIPSIKFIYPNETSNEYISYLCWKKKRGKMKRHRQRITETSCCVESVR